MLRGTNCLVPGAFTRQKLRPRRAPPRRVGPAYGGGYKGIGSSGNRFTKALRSEFLQLFVVVDSAKVAKTRCRRFLITSRCWRSRG
jgi:hypothetical protein